MKFNELIRPSDILMHAIDDYNAIKHNYELDFTVWVSSKRCDLAGAVMINSLALSQLTPLGAYHEGSIDRICMYRLYGIYFLTTGWIGEGVNKITPVSYSIQCRLDSHLQHLFSTAPSLKKSVYTARVLRSLGY